MRGKSKLKDLLRTVVLCVVCVLCCATAKERAAYANWTCECSNKENADYDSKCWKCDKYRDMRPEFDTASGKEFDYGDNVKIKWTGKVGSQGYILAVRNLETDYRPFYNKEFGMYESSYTIKEDLPAGNYKVAIAAIDVYNKQYWCEDCIYFYVNPEQEEYVEITSTPVVEDGEVVSSSLGTSDYGYASVTPEEPELGVGESWVGKGDTGNNDTVTEPDVFVFSPEGVEGDNSTQAPDTSVNTEASKDEEHWYDPIVNFFTKTETEPEDLAPGEFKFSSPKDGKIYKLGKDVTVKWKTSKRATSYTVYLSNEDTGGMWYAETTSAKYKFKSEDLEAGNYMVFVVARNDYGTRVCETLHFSVEQSGKSAVTVSSSGTKVAEGATISSTDPLKITLNSDVSSYSVELVSNTIGKSVRSLKNRTDKNCEISMNYLYPGNEYTLTVVSYSGKDGKTKRTDKLTFQVALDYSNIGSAGKFQAPITKDSNYIITCNKNEYFGESRPAYIKKLASNIEYMIFRAGDAFTEEQVACLRDIYGRQLDRKENGIYALLTDSKGNNKLDEYLEFRYEGVGKGSGTLANQGTKGQADVTNEKANPTAGSNIKFGTFSAMTVVIKNAEVQGVFMRTSTLPDNYLNYPYDNELIKKEYTAVVSAGVYKLYRHNHDTFAAFQLKNLADSATLPAIYDEVTSRWVVDLGEANTSTITGCNIHHNYSNNETSRGSAGCLTVSRQDWSEYMAAYGWSIDENDYWNSLSKKDPEYRTASNDYWKSWTGDLNEKYVGKIVIERLFNIEVDAHNKTFTQEASFQVTK